MALASLSKLFPTDDPQAKSEQLKMYSLFRELDVDGSELLDKREIKTLIKRMGDKMSAAALDAAIERMDSSGKGAVSAAATPGTHNGGDSHMWRFGRWTRPLHTHPTCCNPAGRLCGVREVVEVQAAGVPAGHAPKGEGADESTDAGRR